MREWSTAAPSRAVNTPLKRAAPACWQTDPGSRPTPPIKEMLHYLNEKKRKKKHRKREGMSERESERVRSEAFGKTPGLQ